MEGFTWIVNSDFSFKQFQNFVKEAYEKNRYVTFTGLSGGRELKSRILLSMFISGIYLKRLMMLG